MIEKEFKRARNLVRRETRKIMQNEQIVVAKACKENPKKFWQFVRSKSSSFSSIGNIKHTDNNGAETIITDDSEKSTAFADYFAKVYTREPTGISEAPKQVKPADDMNSIIFSKASIYTKLSKLKIGKSPGPDNIHSRVLKELAPQLASAFKIIFDLSLKTGSLPEEWKCSTVSAIHKKGSKLLVANYRPISLTCITCKVFESLIRDHIMKYFAENKLFSSKQFGFITGRSTVLQLLTLVDDWAKCLETGSQIDIVYTDFEKAFDKVPHQRLLSKLTSYGIHNSIVKWIESFLCFRKLQVRVNGKLSDWMDVYSGIPQGSVLGPLLFVIYINDLPEMCDKDGNLFLFADDAKIYKYVQGNNDATILQKCCQDLYNWSEKWLMKLNIAKCKIMTVTRSKKIIEYKYGFATNGGFVELERVDNMKDLGVI